MQPRILVTGGAGYIGSHTCKALRRAGYEPVTLDNLSLGHRDFVRWGPLVVADIADSGTVTAACRDHHVVAAIHFAAFASVAESTTDPAKYYANNVVGTYHLLEGLRAAGVPAVLFSSSCAVYGSPSEQPIREGTPTNPINAYGASKLMVERMLADYGDSYDLRWSALRYFNACGADAEGEVGELREEESHLIPRALMWIQGHLENFQIFGSNYPTPDGTAIRDYIHVTDLAEAHVLALGALLNGGPSGIFNVGTGNGYSVKEVVDEIERTSGVKIPSAYAERRPGDPPALVADPKRAAAGLGFSPQHSDLGTIIRTAWAWHKKAHPARRSSTAIPNS
jgi:UDP-glucose 4-epimerase/UDP-arabinose 4-epimerase